MDEKDDVGLSKDDELTQILKDVLPERLVTNYVVIAEIVDSVTQVLFLSLSDGMTPWLAHGMLRAAQEMIGSGEYVFPLEEEENNE